MQAHCEICDRSNAAGNPLVGLNEWDAEHGGNPEAFFLCRDCLSRREVASWAISAPQGERIQGALEHHSDVLHPRFTYLSDAKRIHLVRLRPQWVHERILAA